ARRELGAFFASPIAYLVTAGFLAIAGYFFSVILVLSRQATMQFVFGNMVVVLLFIAPLLAMRLLSEEQRSGTIELLMTAPVRDWQVVWGKWLAAFVLFLVMMAFTGLYAVVLWRLGNPDLGPMLSGYLGIILLGGALLALGTLTSAVTENQIVAAVLGVALAVLLYVSSALTDLSGAGSLLGRFFEYLALSEHLSDFTRGVVDTTHVIFYLSVTAGALYLATRALETRRWR
ncbi:MAG: ABC transporter permease, partial [Anaerolineae bacterium]